MIKNSYLRQVDLLLQVLPFVAKEECFALKGGTAINLFLRNMPRLSVDIDLTYIEFDNRELALKNIEDSLRRIKISIEKSMPNLRVNAIPITDGYEIKLNIQSEQAQIKLEVNTVTRGCIFTPAKVKINAEVVERFGKFSENNIVSISELWGGKICAALDRQHPRDLFDIKLLFELEGINEQIIIGVIIALISHFKPIVELLNPLLKDQKMALDNQFKGMTNVEFSYMDFEKTRDLLINQIGNKLSSEQKEFLISFELGNPKWTLLNIDLADKLPAVQWKLLNIEKFKAESPNRHRDMVGKLELFLKG